MKNKIKRGIIWLTSVVLLMGCLKYNVVAAEDQQAPELYIDRYTVNDEEIKIYVNQNQKDSSWISADNTRLLFGSKELEAPKIEKFADVPVKVTYKCLVDVSGSMSQARIDTAKEIIKHIASSKKADDNITISAMANDLIKSDYLTDPLDISEKVSTIKLTKDDTNLYYAIVEELKELSTNDQVGEKRCLIIFSDGADDQATGITREEANKAITESHIPVFTVAMPKNKDGKNDQEMAKILGSFARISSGGVHYYTPDFDNTDLSLIGDNIVNTINNSLVFSEDIRELDTTEKAHELKITVKTSEGNAESVIDVAESDIKRIQEIQEELAPEPEPEPEPEPAPEPVEQIVEEPDKNLIFGLEPIIFYIILAAIILILIIIAIVIVLKKRDSEQDYQQGGVDDLGNTVGGVDDIGVTGDVSDLNGVTMPFEDSESSPTVGFETAPSGKTYHVVLTRMGKEVGDGGVYKLSVVDKYTIGRSASKSKLAISNDSALSGLHCTIFVKNKRIYIKDEGTTNGTFVNGVPITGEFELESGDTLIIGSYEYRITW